MARDLLLSQLSRFCFVMNGKGILSHYLMLACDLWNITCDITFPLTLDGDRCCHSSRPPRSSWPPTPELYYHSFKPTSEKLSAQELASASIPVLSPGPCLHVGLVSWQRPQVFGISYMFVTLSAHDLRLWVSRRLKHMRVGSKRCPYENSNLLKKCMY
jgi:hypothetical protein